MNDYLAESRGTLARTAQKKQTAISIYHRQQQLRKKEEKYGFSVRPSNPNLVDRPDAVEFYFKEVYGEASNKIAQLQQMDASAIDREGEGPIRKLNKEANDLIYERARWGRRLVDVGGSVPEAQLKPAKKMTYFGAAKFLPEALAYIKAASEEAKKKKVSAESGDDELGEEEEEHFAQEEVSVVNHVAESEEGVYGDSSDITTRSSLRWLPLSAPTAAVTTPILSSAAAAAISGWNGLEWMDDEERKLRQLEAVALQQNIGTSRVLSEKAARPLTSTAQSIRGDDDDEKGDEEADYTITSSEGNINKEREVKTAGTTREKKGVEEETTVIVTNHHLNGIAKNLLACARTGSSGAAAVATPSDSLPSEKEFQMRAFAAKKVMMLQQLNRNK